MCIVLVTRSHREYASIILSNRDEFFSRQTSPLQKWHHESQELYSGRDEERGGTWLAVSSTGRWSALTNFRTPGDEVLISPASRGELPLLSITGSLPGSYEGYGGFSLLSGHLLGDEMEVVSNASSPITTKKITDLSSELTNCAISECWPKATTGREKLAALITRDITGDELIQELFGVLKTNHYGSFEGRSDADLLHNLRNSVFIPKLPVAGGYGTRQQTVILVHRHTHLVQIIERTIHEDGTESESREQFAI